MKDDAERAREIGSRLLQSKVWAEARERYLNDATQQDFENHLIRVAGEQAALLAFAQQPEGWRPIETAPKYETSVDLWVENGTCEHGWRITDAWWCADAQAWLTSDADYGMPGNCLGPDDRATYWMPRPAPPAAMLDAAPIPGEE